MTEEQKRIERAIELACRYGGTDEMHHLQWVVDQMVRELAGERYAQIVADATSGEDGPDTYKWDRALTAVGLGVKTYSSFSEFPGFTLRLKRRPQ